MVARSATGSYHICFPAANRWIALPLPPIATDHNTANGFHYDIGAEPGIISFMAVLLDPAGVDVVMFSSKTGNWETKALVVQEDAARDHGRGQPSPGIHAGNCFYWLSASGHGGVLCLDVIGMLTNLNDLYLGANYLDGVIKEDHFARIRSLEDLSLSDNSLKIELSSEWQPPFRLHSAEFATCRMGPLFPAWLRWHVDIKYLGISSTGTLPPFQIAVKFLLLRSNRLTGQIPTLPRNLTVLDISNNSLSGPLPADLPNLEMLSLFSNRISGHIPKSICKSWSLMILDLANNLLEGQLPKCFGNEQIITLELSNNRFSGTLPSSIQNCTFLRILDLAGNMFFGELSAWIADLVNLKFIGLSHNMFSGVIPINITSLKYLQYIDISDNELSGTLPSHLSNLKSFTKSPALGQDGVIYGMYNPGSLSAITKGQIHDNSLPVVGRRRGDAAGSEEAAAGQGRGGSGACSDLAVVGERATGFEGVGCSRWVEDAGVGGRGAAWVGDEAAGV
ncbi:leucine-rich repeat receptor-like protein kinase PXC2 [Setaria italica]|uniref:leucine-rich repeat receptor-like protein kinase PXC2 n=1 Tax=Setaria italica TaxID=4555 RepID=UPI000648905C|nr:leucine-rich repeat receptor-like protein kinase PXC2 [Setaria italica]